ncbi:MAG TPA: L-type lectin-domain containing protein [Cyclobacteriaceae bacterium]
MKILIFIWCLIIYFVCNPLMSSGQFHLIGDADYMPDGCIMLTPDEQYREGIAYSIDRIDLRQHFEIDFDIYLGDKDEGADGITFVMHNDVREFEAYGSWGECMGYGRFNPYSPGNSIDPSIAIEFDTYQNPWQNDPGCDHIAYLENGINLHESYWHNDNDDYDIEDEYLHSFRFTWDPSEMIMTVYFDGAKIYEAKKDIINEIFDGETRVIWGFTASTGRKHNLQYFCLKRFT